MELALPDGSPKSRAYLCLLCTLFYISALEDAVEFEAAIATDRLSLRFNVEATALTWTSCVDRGAASDILRRAKPSSDGFRHAARRTRTN